jgi:heterodisulfide reductase subunit A2
MKKKVVVIGGGIAGMEASAYLSGMGYPVTLLEKDEKIGGHLKKWERLFPTMRLGSEVLEFLTKGVSGNVEVVTNAEIKDIESEKGGFVVRLTDDRKFEGSALLVATGYDVFDARRKEEYGYKIYDNVLTSADLEECFLAGKPLVNAQGKTPKRIGIVHCVGSRDEKVNNPYCSKVCCVTGVKQAIEVKELLPEAEVFCFYMDLRMFGMRFEELYRRAQEQFGVQFIRGRLSESCENADGSIMIKVEDTLAGRPLKMNVDLLVLLVGFEPSKGTRQIGEMLKLELSPYQFLQMKDEHTMTNISSRPGVFLAGTCTSAKTITSTITDARAAAACIANYLENNQINER